MSDEVVETPFGKFLVNPQDCIGSTTKAGTLWDGPGFLQPIALEYGRLGEVGATILDVGANLGTFSVWLAKHEAWRVIAAEPVPETLRYLKANLDLNREPCADRVIPLELAAYNRVSRMRLATAFDANNLGGMALVPDIAGPILAAPLDAYAYLFGRFVSLIKIDAQGCDFAVLQGLDHTISQQDPAPVIVFEWEADLAAAHGHTFEQVRTWLQDRDYTVWPWPSQPNNYLARREGS